ncbi:MAG TPA: carboxymuconolactone decarboxylase family protein [Dongiaceae bacterium]|jgi:AhpD family alkylhydroperoxidase|nr:carboxymuconolactone decarboxylase family protein [Dongiaceae bacterium]
MTSTLNPFTASPAQMKRWLGTSQAVAAGLDQTLVHLVEIRASQINGCAHCLNMHTKAARAAGETEQRLHVLAGWREAPLFTDRERAALGWTEALTRLSEGRPEAEAREALQAQFTEEEQVNLTLMINVINGWNRIVLGFGLWSDEAPARLAAEAAA